MKRFMFFWISQVLSRLPTMSELQRSHFACNKSFQPSWLKNQWDKTQRIFTLNSLFIQLLGEWRSNKNLSFYQLHPSIDSMASWLDAIPLHQGRIAWCAVSHSSEADEVILDSVNMRSHRPLQFWDGCSLRREHPERHSKSSNPLPKDWLWGLGTRILMFCSNIKTTVPNPQSQSFSQSSGSVLPTSVTYFTLSTRCYKPWRPDAVTGTTRPL